MFVKRLALLVFLALIPSSLLASSATTHPLSPEQAVEMLQQGNTRFALGQSIHPNTSFSRRLLTTTDGQAPFATIIACSDSRVPVEILFDQGIGDLFVIKVAGNVADTDEIGSAEYGVDHLGTPVLMVLGHTYCGAVTAVTTGAEVHGSIPLLVDNIVPAVEKAKTALPEAPKNELITRATEENIWLAIADILTKSHAIAERAGQGKVLVIGGVYDILTGRVEILGTHPEQATLLHDAQHAITMSTAASREIEKPTPAEAESHAQDAAEHAGETQKQTAESEPSTPETPAVPEAATQTPAAHPETPQDQPEHVAKESGHAPTPDASAHAEKPSSGRFGFVSFIIFVLLLIGAVHILDKKVLNPSNE